MARPDLRLLALRADPGNWRACGFAVGASGGIAFDGLVLELRGGDPPGLWGWSFVPPSPGLVDGIPDAGACALPVAASHPCGAVAIDHVVVASPDPLRTAAALEALGCERRGEQSAKLDGTPVRRLFLPLPQALLEVVGPATPAPGAARTAAVLWGLTFVSADLDATARLLAGHLAPVRAAVQPGRRIATVRRAAGLGTRVAFLSPRKPDNPAPGDP